MYRHSILIFFFSLIAPLAFCQLNGAYVISIQGNAPFKSIDAAIGALVTSGISGPVTFYLSDPTYTMNSPLLPKIKGSSPTNTITFRPQQGANPVVSSSTEQPLLELDYPDNIVINGSYTDQDTAKHLTFNGQGLIGFNTNTKESSCDNITIKNCIFKGPDVGLGSSAGIGLAHIICNHFVISHNIFLKCGLGVQMRAGNGIIEDNEFYGNRIYGVQIYKSSGVRLSRNSFFNNNLMTVVISNSSNVSVENNRIMDGDKSISAIKVMDSKLVHLINNTVSGRFAQGILYSNSSGSILYNTLSIHPKMNSAGLPSTSNICVSIGQLESSPINFKNNICEINSNDCPSCSGAVIFSGQGSDEAIGNRITENGNIFYCPPTTNFLVDGDGQSYSSYKDWQNAGYSSSSQSKEQKTAFVSSSDLHLTAPNHQGIPIPEITTDIEGNPRDPLHPDAGAYEFKTTTITPSITQDGQCQLSAINFSFKDLPAGTWTVNWNFGDGQTGTGTQIQHVFVSNGTYSVTATVSGTKNYVLTKTIEIQNQPTKPTIKISNGK